MWDGENEKGVLGDFDLATLRDSPHKRGRERTGTIPFMAIELLQKGYFEGKIARSYRHDVESFLWVLVWASMLHDSTWEGRETWQTSNYSTCRASKTELLLLTFPHISPPPEESPRWNLVVGFLWWLKDRTLNPRTDSSDAAVFAEVMDIIEKHWVWGAQDGPAA